MIYYKNLSDNIIGAAIQVHKYLGPGYLEKVYERALLIELSDLSIQAEKQVPIQIKYKNAIVGDYFADIMVEKTIILEIKAISALTSAHQAQLLNYLTATKYKIGYLINFGSAGKLEFKRMVR